MKKLIFSHSRGLVGVYGKRARARSRSLYPLQWVLGLFLLGQGLGFVSRLVAIMAFGALLFASWRKWLSWWGVAYFFAGTLGAFFALPNDASELSSKSSYLVRVQDRPRRKRVGELRVSLLVKGVVQYSDSAEIRIEAFHPVQKIRCRAVDLPWKNSSRMQSAEEYIIRGTFTPLRRNGSFFEYQKSLLRKGYTHSCRLRYVSAKVGGESSQLTAVRQSLAKKIRDALEEKDIAGILLAMLLGVRDGMTRESEEAFLRAGLAHLLVVSGYHVTLVFYSAASLVQAFLSPFFRIAPRLPLQLVARVVGLIVALMYATISGLSSATLRAGLTLLLLFCSQFFERQMSFLNAIFMSLLLLSIWTPGCWIEAGTQFTFGALLGLALGMAVSKQRRSMRACLAGVFFATMASSCLSVFWFGRFSLLGFLCNPLLAPVLALVACKFGLLALGLLVLGVDPSGKCLGLVAEILSWFRDAIVYSTTFPWAAFVVRGWQKWVLGAGLALLICFYLSKRLRTYVLRENLLPKPMNV